MEGICPSLLHMCLFQREHFPSGRIAMALFVKSNLRIGEVPSTHYCSHLTSAL